MTMADSIAVMRRGRIEQLGSPSELYEHPQTAFVARFLGASNLLPGTADGNGAVRLADGTLVRAPAAAGRSGEVAVGIRPEKIRLGGGGTDDSLAGEVVERSYIGVSTQYNVKTAAGDLTVYVQNAAPGAGAYQPGDRVALTWSPEATFVVESQEEEA